MDKSASDLSADFPIGLDIRTLSLSNSSEALSGEPPQVRKGIDLLMNDRETVAVAMKNYFEPNPNFLEGEHINMGCVILSYSFHRLGIKFRYDENLVQNGCECGNFCKDIRAQGKRIRHLDNIKRIENTHKHQWKEAA